MFYFEPYFYIIYATSFLTAIVSASVGFLGGTILLAVMAQFMRMDTLIPLHGVIQLTSNGTRAWILKPYINWLISREAIIGTVIGGIVGYFYLIRIPESVFNLCLGFFILFITFFPKFKADFFFRGKWLVVGIFVSSVGLFMGAVGTLVGSLLFAENLEKKTMISTQAMLQSVVHLMKVIVFSALGFSLTPWLYLILGALLFTYLGTFVGTKILDKIPQALFKKIIYTLLILLSFRLIFTGFYS